MQIRLAPLVACICVMTVDMIGVRDSLARAGDHGGDEMKRNYLSLFSQIAPHSSR